MKLHTCDICNSRVEYVAKIHEGTEAEVFYCKQCVEQMWQSIYVKETENSSKSSCIS